MRDRIRSIALILLVVALLGVGIAGGQAIAFRSRCETTFIRRMQTECGSALNQANTLSRNGNAESTAILGRIRADVHAVDTINDMSLTLYGGEFVAPEIFVALYNIIDSYTHDLKNGVTTLEEQTNLVNTLTQLQTELAGLL